MEVEKVSGARRVDEMRRFRMLMAGVYSGIAISSGYGYSIFASYISTEYKFDQRAITTISTVGCVFLYFPLPFGFVLDHFGPQAVFPMAAVLGFFGFLLFGLTFQGYITPSVVALSVFNGMLNWGCACMESGVVMPLMLNFPRDAGAMVIIQKTFAGLGTSVLMAYFQGWFQGNYGAYAFFLGAQHAVCAMVAFVFIRFPPYYQSLFEKRRTSPEKLKELQATQQLYLKQKASARRLMVGCALVICLLVFLFTQSVAMAYKGGDKDNFHNKAIAMAVVTVVLVTLFASMALPFQFLGAYVPVTLTHIPGVGIATVPTVPLETMEVVDEREKTEGNVQPMEEMTPWAAAAEVEEEAECQKATEETTAEVKEVAKVQVWPQHQESFLRNLLTPDLWCLWFTCFAMWGTTLVMSMNAAQIYSSINHGTSVISTRTMYVSVMSIGSAIGRISMGTCDMILSARQRAGKTKVLTTTLLLLPPCLSCLAFLLFAVVPAKALIIAFLIGAMGNGTSGGICLLSVRKMYAKDVGRHYTFCFSAAMVAVILLNSVMFGRLYDMEAKRLGYYPQCRSPSCVRTSMWILMGISALGVFSAFFVHIRFRNFTAREFRRREGQSAEDENGLLQLEAEEEMCKGPECGENLSDSVLGNAPDSYEPVVSTYTPCEKRNF